MLHLSARQIDDLADASFTQRILAMLGKADASAPSRLRTETGKRQLRDLIERARQAGMHAELDIGRFVITAWFLGLDFDKRFPAMREILAEPRLSPTQKADAIERLATTVMDTLHQGRQR